MREIDPAHPSFRPFVEFDQVIVAWRPSLEPREILAFDGDDPASRFCFDNSAVDPGPRDSGSLISQSYVAMLETWRDGIEAGIDTPPSDVVAHFIESGVPPWADEETFRD